MERDDRAVATFHVSAVPAAGGVATLDESAAHHVRVRRLSAGDRVRLTNGAGTLGAGAIDVVRKHRVDVVVEQSWTVPRLPELHLVVPVGDRERMLWLAEKATELGITSWRAVRFHRSASVNPRGEGTGFASKVRARMTAALEQSGGAWLPAMQPDGSLSDLCTASESLRIVLDGGGAPIHSLDMLASCGPVAVVFGPEGGLEPDELAALVDAGWRPTSLGPTTLRFETAGISACAVLRAMTCARG